jgi:hypothetical protein
MWFSEYVAIFDLNRIRSSILVTETQCVFFKLRKECLDIINIGFHTGSGGVTDSCAKGIDTRFLEFKMAEI